MRNNHTPPPPPLLKTMYIDGKQDPVHASGTLTTTEAGPKHTVDWSFWPEVVRVTQFSVTTPQQLPLLISRRQQQDNSNCLHHHPNFTHSFFPTLHHIQTKNMTTCAHSLLILIFFPSSAPKLSHIYIFIQIFKNVQVSNKKKKASVSLLFSSTRSYKRWILKQSCFICSCSHSIRFSPITVCRAKGCTENSHWTKENTDSAASSTITELQLNTSWEAGPAWQVAQMSLPQRQLQKHHNHQGSPALLFNGKVICALYVSASHWFLTPSYITYTQLFSIAGTLHSLQSSCSTLTVQPQQCWPAHFSLAASAPSMKKMSECYWRHSRRQLQVLQQLKVNRSLDVWSLPCRRQGTGWVL